jgi:thiamine kinase-like enzyme
MAAWFATPPIGRVQAMRHDQALFLDALEQLPRTLCHLDLHPANLFADRDRVTAAIDWSFVGLGAIGEDAGNLVPDAVLDFHIPADRIDDLYETVAGGYEAGLRDAGWDGPSSAVRLGMAATIAAKYAWILPAMLRAALENRELLNGRPFDEALQWWAPTVGFLLDRADEARNLISER